MRSSISFITPARRPARGWQPARGDIILRLEITRRPIPRFR
jgi:hypothetical protein